MLSAEANKVWRPGSRLVTPSGRVYVDPVQVGAEPARLMYRVGKKKAGRLLDGREWNEFPEIKASA